MNIRLLLEVFIICTLVNGSHLLFSMDNNALDINTIDTPDVSDEYMMSDDYIMPDDYDDYDFLNDTDVDEEEGYIPLHEDNDQAIPALSNDDNNDDEIE